MPKAERSGRSDLRPETLESAPIAKSSSASWRPGVNVKYLDPCSRLSSTRSCHKVGSALYWTSTRLPGWNVIDS